jgi:hypothetical protein
MRVISAPTILTAIGADRSHLLDDLCARCSALIAAAPMRYDWNLAAIVIGKTGRACVDRFIRLDL